MDVEQGVTLVFISVLNYYLRVQNKGIDYVKVIRIYMDGCRLKLMFPRCEKKNNSVLG